MLPIFVAVVALSLAASGSVLDRSLGLEDIQDMFDHLGDEILTHGSLGNHLGAAAAADHQGSVHDLSGDEAKQGEEGGSDDDDVPHPVKVNNWGSRLDVGQVAGVTVDNGDNPVIFHRGCHIWDTNTFDSGNRLRDRTPVPNATVVTVDAESGEAVDEWGADTFYMPHGIAVDAQGNVYLTDVGTHQVYRFAPGQAAPNLVLGEKFVPGSDNGHFCQPTSVAVVEATGDFFVADGYCNSRVMKFDRHGNLLNIISGDWKVVHSLALFEEEDVLCLSDRDNDKVECVRAGVGPVRSNPALSTEEDLTGRPVVTYKNVGRTYAIAPKGTALLSVNGAPGVRGITIDTAADKPQILDQWGKGGEMDSPHDLSISHYGDAVFVADLKLKADGRGTLHKFEVVRKEDFP